MGELTVTLLRLGYLLVLWLFVLAALVTLRRDVYGTTIRRRDRATGGRSRGKARVALPPGLAVPSVIGPAPASPPMAVGGQPRPVAGVRLAAHAGADVPTRLVVKSGPLRGTTLPLARSPVVIGRSSTANLVLDDDFASGRHAQLVPRAGGWVLEDLGSTNGTFLGRERIAGPVALAAGQSIRIGDTTLEVLK